MSSRTVDRDRSAIEQALESIHAGRLDQAIHLCREVLARNSGNFNALQLLGQVALQRRDYPSAGHWLSRAHAVNPSSAAVCSNLAVACLALGRPRDALASCDRALALQPGHLQANCNRGHALCALGQPEQALVAYERALASNPQFYDGHVGRVRALKALGRLEEALAACEPVLRLGPQLSGSFSLLAMILQARGRLAEALRALDRALELEPHSPELLNDRGTVLRNLRRPQDALEMYTQALRLRSDFPEVFCNVANVGFDAGRYAEALAHCDRALASRPDFVEALNLRGTALQALKRPDEAASAYRRILELAPEYGHTRSHLLSARAQSCDWTQRAELIAAIRERLERGRSACAPHAFLWMSDSTRLQLRCASTFCRDQFPPAAPLWRGERYRHERLRIAYLSADFSDHPVAHLIAGVLEGHDRRAFETIGVSSVREPTPTAMRVRLQRSFEHFLDVSELGDREAAQRLRDLEVDILVDLTGHTRNGRLGVLACRPAPLQLNYLGFTGTSGAPYVDYLIGDEVAIPEDSEPFFSERICRLPTCFLPNDDRQRIAPSTPSRGELGLPPSAFVFCAFHNAYKINPATFDVWMGLLRETPGSVLWLRGESARLQENLRREASARGVDAERLVFATRIAGMAEHLARYRQADLFLDSWPYGAHATARDALWAGLPVLTCTGQAFASRVAASLLSTVGLPQLIAADLEDYRARALMLAHSPALLGEWRAALAVRLRDGASLGTDAYRRQLETAYRLMWERHARGEHPTSLHVPP